MLYYDAMLPTTRKDAAAIGSTLFNTGRPCRHGHIADRYTSTGNCSECLKSSRSTVAEALRESRKPVPDGSRLFTYRLHPDDHAAALAFCQALDLQRGRLPSATQAVEAPPPPVIDPASVARAIQQTRDRLLNIPPRPEAHLPAEFAAVLRSDERH